MSPLAHPLVARLGARLAERTPQRAERDAPFLEAAVALVLRPAGTGLETLLIRRAERAGDPWSGQIALPGGRHDPSDPSLEATALRETLEEVGLDLAADGVLLGVLDELRPRTRVLPPVIVRPVVVALTPEVGAPRTSDEVAEWFWAPLDRLFADGARRREVPMGGVRLRAPAIDFEGRVIWGMTERILRGLEALL